MNQKLSQINLFEASRDLDQWSQSVTSVCHRVQQAADFAISATARRLNLTIHIVKDFTVRGEYRAVLRDRHNQVLPGILLAHFAHIMQQQEYEYGISFNHFTFDGTTLVVVFEDDVSPPGQSMTIT